MKYKSHGNFFALPNEIFLWGLTAGELAVYSFLRRCEDRKTRQCWPSIQAIGNAVGMSENTARKYFWQRKGGLPLPTAWGRCSHCLDDKSSVTRTIFEERKIGRRKP